MRKIALLGLFVVLTTGCGRGWLPIFRGAPCQSGCGLPAAGSLPGCNNCGGATAGYGSYDGSEYYSGDVLGDGTVAGSGYYGDGIIVGSSDGTLSNPSLVPVQPAP